MILMWNRRLSVSPETVACANTIREGKIKRGDVVILVAFGAGLICGANVIRF
jgi:3-oxoacyl-[acyl-carrier-protein] synthase III